MQVKAKVKDKQLIGEKRKQIIDGAITVFKKKGYHKATVREIAEEAGVGIGSIYDYVKSKDDILFLFFENYVKNFYERVKASSSELENPLQRLRKAYRAFVEVAMELEDQVMLSYTQAKYVKKEYLKDILKKESDIVYFFKGILDNCADGLSSFDTYMEASFLVFSGVFGVLRRWTLRPFYSKKEVVDFLVESQVGRITRKISEARTQKR